MDPADIAALFYGDEATGPEKAQQLAAALRGDTQLGQLGMLTGDKVLGGVGQSLVQGAQQGQQQLEKAANMRLTRAMEAEKQKTEQEFRQSQERHMSAEERFRQQQLAQGRFIVSAPTANSPGFITDAHTGTSHPMLPQPTGASGQPLSQKQIEKEFTELTDKISTSRGRGNLNMEQQKRLNASERIKAIAMNPDGSPRDLSPGLMTELAGASAGLITGGSPAEHTIAAMTPSTVGSDWAKIQQWLSNEPHGTSQQKFVQTLLDQAKREEDVIRPQIQSAQLQAVPNYAHLSKVDKRRYEGILKAAGLDPSRIDEQGLLIQEAKAAAAAAAGGGAPGGGGLSPADQKAVDWAKKNPTNPDAQNILKLHHMAP
jgi:hypothetical protein